MGSEMREIGDEGLEGEEDGLLTRNSGWCV